MFLGIIFYAYNFNIYALDTTELNILLYKKHFYLNIEKYFYINKNETPYLYFYKNINSFNSLSFIHYDLNSGFVRDFKTLSNLSEKEIIKLAEEDARNYIFEVGRSSIIFLTFISIIINCIRLI